MDRGNIRSDILAVFSFWGLYIEQYMYVSWTSSTFFGLRSPKVFPHLYLSEWEVSQESFFRIDKLVLWSELWWFMEILSKTCMFKGQKGLIRQSSNLYKPAFPVWHSRESDVKKFWFHEIFILLPKEITY